MAPTDQAHEEVGHPREEVQGSVEVDAVPPARLRELVTDCIVRHIDTDALERMETVEAAERDTLASIVGNLTPRRTSEL